MPVRSSCMMPRLALLAALSGLALAGCERKAPEPQPGETPSSGATPSVSVPPMIEATPKPGVAPAPKLDMGVLDERRDPDRLLRFYAAALHARDWSAASRAWSASSGVTAATLKAAYDRPEPPTLDVGKGQQEGAAGSLYYEAPVTLRFGAGAAPETGTLTLRRVNDVDGATPEQLRWHIERVTIGVGQ